jgi:bifunctional UDP-N-acetylglucosamine pyrophosphorylase/glucosamine-1-phosphate N-acetyltransferase
MFAEDVMGGMIDGGAPPPVEAVILAAGKGTRMKSDLPKVLHRLAGRPLIAHVLDVVRAAGIARSVVVGFQADRVQEVCAAPDLIFVVQEPQLGTGHAVQVAAPLLRRGGLTVVLNGDTPLLRPQTVSRLVDLAWRRRLAASLLTCLVGDAGAYGRILKDERGRLLRIVEARDATPAQRAIQEFNTGVYCFRTDDLLTALFGLTDDNDQREYYLTDTIGHLVAAGKDVEALTIQDADEVIGVNTVAELMLAERLLARRQASPPAGTSQRSTPARGVE